MSIATILSSPRRSKWPADATAVIAYAIEAENGTERWRLTAAEKASEAVRIAALVGPILLNDRGELIKRNWIEAVAAAVRRIGPRVALERLTFRRVAAS